MVDSPATLKERETKFSRSATSPLDAFKSYTGRHFLWGVCVVLILPLLTNGDLTMNALLFLAVTSLTFRCAPLPALTDRPDSLCAIQAAATGPNQTSSTWQPFKYPVRSSSAVTFILTHRTHTQASADAHSEAGPGHPLHFGAFIRDLRRAAKIAQNRSIIQRMRRGRRGPVALGAYTATTRGNTTINIFTSMVFFKILLHIFCCVSCMLNIYW